MKSNINEIPLKFYLSIPKVWNGIFNYHNATDRHYQDGWRDVIVPQYNENTESIVGLVKAGDNITYEIIPLAEETIKERLKQEAEFNKQQIIQERINKQIIEQLQTVENDEELVKNKAAFPFWEEGITVEAGKKYQAFDGIELKLYRVISSHVTEPGKKPDDTPSLFKMIEVK